MAFTDVEMAILSQLAYAGSSEKTVAPQKGDSLYSLITENEAWLEKKLGDNYKAALKELKKKAQSGDYTIVKAEDNKEGSGFAAFAVSDPEGGVTVACRGTEGFNLLDEDSIKDLDADIELTLSLQSWQQEDMEKFVRDLEKDKYTSYSFTGHSLGGNLAMYGAICLSEPDKLNTCVTFNAPGFNVALMEKYSARISEIENRMINYQGERDGISDAGTVPGRVIVLESVVGGVGGLGGHGLNALVPNAQGSFQISDTGKKGTAIGFFFWSATLLTDVVLFVLSPFVRIDDFLQWRRSEGREVCRDFSQETKEMLLDAARETEEEKWWQITRWDCWYKVDKLFGGLAADWDRYSGNVDTYYRKLIDMNDASVKDIENIFRNVYAIDSAYAGNVHECMANLVTDVRRWLEDIRDSIHLAPVNTAISVIQGIINPDLHHMEQVHTEEQESSREQSPIDDRDAVIQEYEAENPEVARRFDEFLEESGIGEEDAKNIKATVYRASEPYRSIYLEHLEDYKVKLNEEGRSNHNPSTNVTTVDVDEHLGEDPDGAYDTFFHESGHAIDDYERHGLEISSKSAYNSSKFEMDGKSIYDCLSVDVRNNVRSYISENYSDLSEKEINTILRSMNLTDDADFKRQARRLGLEDARLDQIRTEVLDHYYDNVLEGRENGDICDAYEGVTNEVFCRELTQAEKDAGVEHYGHYDEAYYWYGGASAVLRDVYCGGTFKPKHQKGTQAAELWANFFSAQMRGDEEKLALMKEHFPTAYAAMEKMALEMAQ